MNQWTSCCVAALSNPLPTKRKTSSWLRSSIRSGAQRSHRHHRNGSASSPRHQVFNKFAVGCGNPIDPKRDDSNSWNTEISSQFCDSFGYRILRHNRLAKVKMCRGSIYDPGNIWKEKRHSKIPPPPWLWWRNRNGVVVSHTSSALIATDCPWIRKSPQVENLLNLTSSHDITGIYIQLPSSVSIPTSLVSMLACKVLRIDAAIIMPQLRTSPVISIELKHAGTMVQTLHVNAQTCKTTMKRNIPQQLKW